MSDESKILHPNLIRPENREQAEDILLDLNAVLRKHQAELFFRLEQRGMLLMVPDDRKPGVSGKYRVIAIVKSLTRFGVEFEKAVFTVDMKTPEFSEQDTASVKRMLGGKAT